MPPKSIECKVVKVLSENKSNGGSTQVRVVRWIVDGKDTGPLLEKRNFFNTKDGDTKMGKAKGMNKEDLQQIIDNWQEIGALL